MEFCPDCDSIMRRNTASGHVRFICKCGREIEGAPADARVGGSEIDPNAHLEMFADLFASAAHDPVNVKEKRVCPRCKLDYMTMVRVTQHERIIYICKCGWQESPSPAS